MIRNILFHSLFFFVMTQPELDVARGSLMVRSALNTLFAAIIYTISCSNLQLAVSISCHIKSETKQKRWQQRIHFQLQLIAMSMVESETIEIIE